MAYCRADGVCKVYMYRGSGGYVFHVPQKPSFSVRTPEEALKKLQGLKAAGMGIPEYAIERLKTEIRAG